jgi:ATP-binding cassette subfamily B protein
VKDAPILILDEPTSSVDVGTEASIIDAIERLMAGRTTFMVAHRLSTLRNCHMLLFVEDGRCRLVTEDVGSTLIAARRGVAGGPSAARGGGHA